MRWSLFSFKKGKNHHDKEKLSFKKWLSMLLTAVMLVAALPISAFAAPASGIPANMLDNVYLDALAYTGYNVQAQRTTARSL